MKLALLGVGNAGARIVDEIVSFEQTSGRPCSYGNRLVFNTNPAVFDSLSSIRQDQEVLIGDTFHDVKGTGVNGNVELGVSVAKEETNEIHRALDSIEMYDLDATLMVTGLGGGTGSGVGSVLLDELQTVYEKPVYTLGVLPAESEDDQRILNAARGIRTMVPLADNVFPFDNNTWFTDGAPHEENFATANEELAKRIVFLFGTGENKDLAIPSNCVDPSDIMRTLDTGGVSSIGYATTNLAADSGGLIAWLRSLFSRRAHPEDEEQLSDAEIVRRLVRRAVTSELTLPCDVSSAERTLILLSGPPDSLSRKGFETARYWVEQEADTVEVLAGDEPDGRSKTMSAIVLLSNVTTVPVIKELQDSAVDVLPLAAAEESRAEAEFTYD